MKWVFAAAELVWRVRQQLRFGERSRVPLKLMRLELREDFAECEWIARPPDPWDLDLPTHVREQNETWQALRDALSVREALLTSIPEIRCAQLKVYRQQQSAVPQLIISGSVSLDDAPPPRVASLVMRAKLFGFRFELEDGSLRPLTSDHEPDFAGPGTSTNDRRVVQHN
jgi:hypothetical protein